jgi:2-hydroxy-3-keto-5-methylthiopentenyl-1-phosphate phosphatase
MRDELSYIVFTDFDGTITRNDIGDSMFKVFGNPEKCSEAFRETRDGKIGMTESWVRSCATVESLSATAFDAFVEWQDIDAGFQFPFILSAMASTCISATCWIANN